MRRRRSFRSFRGRRGVPRRGRRSSYGRRRVSTRRRSRRSFRPAGYGGYRL